MTVGQDETRTATAGDVRADYITGLRALADLLDQDHDLPLPTTGRTDAFNWWVFASEVNDPKAAIAAIVRALPGPKKKDVGEGGGSSWLTVETSLYGLRIDINSPRDNVCTRVVTGVREVTEDVPDPDALAAVPTVTVTKMVEDVEWVCEPLLAPREQVQS